MEYLPSPPSSPIATYESYNDSTDHYANDDGDEAIHCGSCSKALGKDWFCSTCHKKCSTCGRILTRNTDDYCTRCWIYIPSHNIYLPSQRQLASLIKARTSPI